MPSASHRIVRLAETGSTNKDAMRLALKGEPLPLWVMAERQTDGRGRAGRTWISEVGNLHASVAFDTAAATDKAGQLALAAGLALYDAVAGVSGLAESSRLRLKWPNDLMISGAKVAGILTESTFQPGGRLIVVAGFGVNIVSAPALDRPVTALKHEGVVLEAENLVSLLADALQTWLEIWDGGAGFHLIRNCWLERGGPLGEPITIHAGPEPVSGTYQGLSASGALLAEVGGRLETFNFGDVALGTASGSKANG